MLSTCCWIFSQGCCQISLKSAGTIILNYCNNFWLIFYAFLRERGVLAEGAKFMMMSLDYDIPKLLHSELNEIRSFHFYRLINPKHQDLMALGKRLNICPDSNAECRLVPIVKSILAIFLTFSCQA